MFREFESKQRELNQWLMRSRSEKVRKYLQQSDVIEYLFALGIYYRYVIAPLTRSGEFVKRIQDYDIPEIVVGGRELSNEFRQSMAKAAAHFHSVLTEYGLNERFFAITDVKKIVMTLIEIESRMRDGRA